MFHDIVKVAGIDELNLQMLMSKHPGLCLLQTCVIEAAFTGR